jgi:hypothetical protein
MGCRSDNWAVLERLGLPSTPDKEAGSGIRLCPTLPVSGVGGIFVAEKIWPAASRTGSDSVAEPARLAVTLPSGECFAPGMEAPAEGGGTVPCSTQCGLW